MSSPLCIPYLSRGEKKRARAKGKARWWSFTPDWVGRIWCRRREDSHDIVRTFGLDEPGVVSILTRSKEGANAYRAWRKYIYTMPGILDSPLEMEYDYPWREAEIDLTRVLAYSYQHGGSLSSRTHYFEGTGALKDSIRAVHAGVSTSSYHQTVFGFGEHLITPEFLLPEPTDET